MTGTELSTFCEELNGGASIGDTLLFQFINLAKAMVEQLRPWMVLRASDTSKAVTAANTWQSAQGSERHRGEARGFHTVPFSSWRLTEP
jgi:hypothetical protein